MRSPVAATRLGCPGILLAVTALLLAGCVPQLRVYQYYEGPPLPPAEQATLSVAWPLHLVTINGDPIPDAQEVRLEPGQYRLEYRAGLYINAPGRRGEKREVSFAAAAGHEYTLFGSGDASNRAPVVADLTTEALVGGQPFRWSRPASSKSLTMPVPSSVREDRLRDTQVVWSSSRAAPQVAGLGTDPATARWRAESTGLGEFLDGWWSMLLGFDPEEEKPIVHEVVLSHRSGDTTVEFMDAGEGGNVGFVYVEVGNLAHEGQGPVALRLTLRDGFLREAVGVYDGERFSSFEERVPYVDKAGRLHLLRMGSPGTT